MKLKEQDGLPPSYHKEEVVAEDGANNFESQDKNVEVGVGKERSSKVTFLYQQDAPSCQECGSIMIRNGTCYKCLNCGTTSGCS